MRVRLDAGALARYLGHPDAFARAPGELDEELVLPVLEIAPFVLSEDGTAVAPGAGPGPPIGEGVGVLKISELANPAAGASPEFTVPAGKLWRIITIHGELTTSAVAGMREVSLFIHPNNTALPIVRGLPALEQAASLAFQYTWAEWSADAQRSDSSVGLAIERLPANLVLTDAFRIRLLTNNIQAGDQWAKLRVYVGEFSA